MRTLLIDDEPLAIELLADYVARHDELTLAASFTDPIEALAYLRDHTVDLVFLDVQMPELNGLHVARLIGSDCPVVLTTAHGEHARRAFELDVTDYLLKPVSFARFSEAVDRARRRQRSGGNPAPAPPVPEEAPFFIKSGYRTLRLDLDQLTHATSSGDYLVLYLTDGTQHLISENLTDLCARLPAGQFCRIHRSHLVALNKIDFVERRRVVIGDVWLPVSDGHREELQRAIGPS